MSAVVWVLWPLEQNTLIWMLLYESSCKALHVKFSLTQRHLLAQNKRNEKGCEYFERNQGKTSGQTVHCNF